MRDDPLIREALRCIRCAACANVCPPYAVVGGHVFGYIYSGAIGLVNTPFHHGLEAAAGPQSLCVSCNACATVCPVGIPLPQQILAVRAEVAEEYGPARAHARRRWTSGRSPRWPTGAARRRAGRRARCARAASPGCRAWALDLIPQVHRLTGLAHAARACRAGRPATACAGRARARRR